MFSRVSNKLTKESLDMICIYLERKDNKLNKENQVLLASI